MLAIARTFADTPEVREAVAGADPSAALQPLAEDVRRDTGTDFVVVMTVDGVRFTHPDPTQIGRHFLGTIAPAARGEPVTETYTGTLAPPCARSCPSRTAARVVALVAVGRTVEAVSRELTPAAGDRAGRGRRRARRRRGRIVPRQPLAAAYHPGPRAR
jgi:sensor histidine kinase regulating citrate/malate metabolism